MIKTRTDTRTADSGQNVQPHNHERTSCISFGHFFYCREELNHVPLPPSVLSLQAEGSTGAEDSDRLGNQRPTALELQLAKTLSHLSVGTHNNRPSLAKRGQGSPWW